MTTRVVHLKEELETYEANLQSLLASAEGKFVLIQGKKICGTWDTYEDALKVGYQAFGVATPFLVKQVTGIEQVHWFSRELSSCP